MLHHSIIASSMVAWPNGKALDYESRDSRFDPWRDHFCWFVPCQNGCTQGEFFRLVQRSTDVAVGCTFPPKFCPSIASAHRNRGHCAYRFSINSSRCLFFCTCTLKTSMSSRICFVLKLAEIKQFGLSRLAQQTFKPSPDEVEATPTPSLMAHLFIVAISWHLLPDTALHLIMEA